MDAQARIELLRERYRSALKNIAELQTRLRDAGLDGSLPYDPVAEPHSAEERDMLAEYPELTLADIREIGLISGGCDNCGVSSHVDGGELKLCSLCKEVAYCSETCQRAHWKQHKQVCTNYLQQRKQRKAAAKVQVAERAGLNEPVADAIAETEFVADAIAETEFVTGERVGLNEPEPISEGAGSNHTISPEQRALMSSAAEEPDLNVQSLARQIADSIPTELALKTVLRTMGIDMWIKAANPLINLQHPLIMEDCR